MVCTAVLLLACSSALRAAEPEAPEDAQPPLVFLAEVGSPPLSYYENGVAKGIYIDITKAVAEKMHRSIRIELMDWKAAQERVARGEADGLVFLATSEQRRALFDFSDSAWTDDYGIFVRSGDIRIHTVEDLAGKRVGVTRGGYPVQFFRDQPSTQLVFFQNYEEGFGLLRSGGVDAVATHTWLATFAIQQRGWRDVALGQAAFVSVPAGFGIKKGNRELLQQLNVAIQAVKADGTISRIHDRWHSQDILFFSRERFQRTIQFYVLGFLAVAFAAMAFWVLTLKKQIRIRKAAETALSASEERLAKAFAASPDCIVLADLETGAFVDVNRRFEALSGLAREQIIGKTASELGMVFDPGMRERVVNRLKETGSVHDFEYDVQLPTGLHAKMELSAAVIELDGRKVILGVHRDLTEHKRAQEALLRTESRFRQLVENANDIIFTVDRNGLCLSMNRMGEKITGYAQEDPRGMSFQQLVVPRQAAVAWAKLERVLAGDDIQPFEIDIISRTGKTITLELNVQALYENGVPVGAQGIARDITMRRELESQLRQAQKMEAVGQLAAGVAHDFNNLLTVIMGNCEASTAEMPHNHPLQESFTDIQTAAQRAASLTSQLLAFSRRQVIQPQPLNLSDVIGETQRMLRRVIGEDITFEFIPAADLGLVNVDEGQIHQIVMNLAVNARDAMPHGGRLILETANVLAGAEELAQYPQMPAGDYVRLSIADNGIGMDEATRTRIFEPFFTTKEIGRGTGLGLATVYGIVKQSEGFIWVSSAPGLGAKFSLYFPMLAAKVDEQPALPEHAHAFAGRETLMLVEDEKPLRELLTKHLKHSGYDVLTAEDGDTSLQLGRSLDAPPALLITDVVMPGMSGPALSDSLRETFPDLKVLYLSGYSDEALLRRGVLPNGTYFLQKPFMLSALASKVREIIDAG